MHHADIEPPICSMFEMEIINLACTLTLIFNLVPPRFKVQKWIYHWDSFYIYFLLHKSLQCFLVFRVKSGQRVKVMKILSVQVYRPITDTEYSSWIHHCFESCTRKQHGPLSGPNWAVCSALMTHRGPVSPTWRKPDQTDLSGRCLTESSTRGGRPSQICLSTTPDTWGRNSPKRRWERGGGGFRQANVCVRRED